ncbi:MAG: hypothetical protein JSU58_02595 [Dehalococcoidales bacterium]|nr:MAG: hypothetical protein JSU58_02595 [Dehalococcoidales bacterium]
MNSEVIRSLNENACASIRFRTRKEILGENPDVNDYLDEIVADKRIQYAFSWQKENGFLGNAFHAGWIPEVKMKYLSTGAEGALRFLSEMAVPETHPVVRKGLDALLRDNWNPDRWKWSTIFDPAIGLFGADNIRAVVFAYFGIEDHDFIQTEIQRALGYVGAVSDIRSIEEITGTYRQKLYYSGTPLPDLYNLKLLAFTQSWRNDENIDIITHAIENLIDLSPLPKIYIKLKSQLIAPAKIQPVNLTLSPRDLGSNDWFWWIQTIELFARMGVIKNVTPLLHQANELKEMLEAGKGYFPVKPASRNFEVWGVYPGLALEDSWKNDGWKYDMTFRSLLILKYAGLL